MTELEGLAKKTIRGWVPFWTAQQNKQKKTMLENNKAVNRKTQRRKNVSTNRNLK